MGLSGMEIIGLIFSNYYIDVGVLSWFSAQVIKTLLFYVKNGVFQAERMVGAGGMPSAHSAFVCSITIAMAKKLGFSSPEFAISLAFASVVMYDAMVVRRAAGEQAKVINRLMVDFSDPQSLFALLKGEREELPDADSEEQKELNEFLGHTPLEVLGGALLGILIAMLVPVF